MNDKGFERITLYPLTMTVKTTLNDTLRVVAERVSNGDRLKGRTTYDRERALVIPFITAERVVIHDQPVEQREIEQGERGTRAVVVVVNDNLTKLRVTLQHEEIVAKTEGVALMIAPILHRFHNNRFLSGSELNRVCRRTDDARQHRLCNCVRVYESSPFTSSTGVHHSGGMEADPTKAAKQRVTDVCSSSFPRRTTLERDMTERTETVALNLKAAQRGKVSETSEARQRFICIEEFSGEREIIDSHDLQLPVSYAFNGYDDAHAPLSAPKSHENNYSQQRWSGVPGCLRFTMLLESYP